MTGRNKKNILFLMFDQLRRDYLGCYGHPSLKTPHIDRLANMGVRFDRAYVQAPLCGPSRMSTYTGRYVSSHGATWNNVPLNVGQPTMGDHLRRHGMECWLVGKTHMKADLDGMERLGIDPESPIGQRVAECGFDVFERDDGLRSEGPGGFYDPKGALAYNAYLRAQGYDSDNPWHDFANSGVEDDGRVLSGWFLENSDQPANIAEEHSETPYMFRRGRAFIEAQGDSPWCCHLSLIKPHWPYIVPDPYASMYGAGDFLPANRSEAEKANAHPVLAKMQAARISTAFADDDIRAKVVQAYMGLVKQIDDQVGELLDWLEQTGRMDDTMIVLTSDHGDFLGDHWLGEKMFFYDCSVRVPLIIYDPSAEADATRGTVSDALVEAVDLLPTFVDVSGGDACTMGHQLDGQSLLPLLHGTGDVARDFVISELDTAGGGYGGALGLPLDQARIWMIADRRWKLISFETGDRPMLFDLENDPDELTDLGASDQHRHIIQNLTDQLNTWHRRPSARTTISRAQIEAIRKGGSPSTGVLIGVRNAEEAGEAGSKYVGRIAKDHRRRQ